jgi:V/A-type H+-transporting ATPase subunit D
MTQRRLAPTRMNLLRARRELARVQRGVVLTRRKREALVVELFAAARPAVGFRARIAAAITQASVSLADALAVHGAHALDAMAMPPVEPSIELQSAVVWGIPVTDVIDRSPVVRSIDARALAPSLTGPSTADAAERFERLVELLIDAAPREQRMRRLGDALSQANRRLRTLEQRVAPALTANITAVRRQLEEREREEQLRLRHVLRRGVQ